MVFSTLVLIIVSGILAFITSRASKSASEEALFDANEFIIIEEKDDK